MGYLTDYSRFDIDFPHCQIRINAPSLLYYELTWLARMATH